MKKIYSWMLAAICVGALSVSCKQDAFEPSTPSEGKTVKVEVSLAEELKGSFTDNEGLKWEVGDIIWCRDAASNWDQKSMPLSEEDISADGTKAQFSFGEELISKDRNLEFVSLNNHGSNINEVTFTLNDDGSLSPTNEFNAFTQSEVGVMNKRRLFLHNGTTLIANKAGNIPKVSMAICGTIFRVLPYTTTHNDEKVLSVQMSTADGTKLVGTVVYDRANGTYQSATQKNYASYNMTKATLSTPFSLDCITSKELSKGIYLPVPATSEGESFDGYQFMIETDKGMYFFMTDKSLTISENTVKNIYLNLENSKKGFLRYDGSLSSSSDYVFPSESSENNDLGYWKAQVSSNGSSWEDRLNAENSAYYENVTFDCIDATTHQPVDWVSVKYGANDLCHWIVDLKENLGDDRKAIIQANYSDVNGYGLISGFKTKAITVVQKSAGAVKVIDFNSGIGENTSIGDQVIESGFIDNQGVTWFAIRVDGKIIEGTNPLYSLLYGNVSFSAYSNGVGSEIVDWLTVSYKKDDTWININAKANTGAERKALVYCEFKAPEGYEFKEGVLGYKDKSIVYMQFFVTQKSGMTVNASFENVYSELVPAEGASIEAAKLSISVNATALADYTKLSDYGLSVSASAGTLSIAADGTVSLVVPENKPNKEKTYTISLKQDSKLLASCEIKQAAGTEEVSDTHTFQYTIFNNAENGSNKTGFGPDVVGTVGEWYRIENVVIDGYTYKPGDDLKNLVSDTDLINALTSHIFSFGEITESDVQVPGTDPLTTNPESFVEIVPWTDGGAAIYFRIVFKNKNTTGVRRTFKIITKDANGDVTSTIVYFQNA